MRVQEHIDKISWSFADKALFFIYGIVTLFQMRALQPGEWGLFGLMIGLHTWIFIVIDSFALQGLIQFGMNETNKKKVNSIALIIQLFMSVIFSLLIYLLRFELAIIFNEDGFIKIGFVLPVLILLTIPRTYVIKLIYRTQEFHKLFLVNASFFAVMTFLTIYYLINNHFLTFNDMIIIYLFGSGLSSAFSILLLRKELQFNFSGDIKILKIMKFSLPWTIYSALNYLPKTLDLFVVQYFFQTEATGVYYSAKNLFRVFDETLNASYGLVYPAAVRQIEKNNTKGLNDLMTKSVSFLLFAFIIAVLILEFGLSEFIITSFLPANYHSAVGQFNLLLIAALGMPFLMLYTVITAMGKPQIVMNFAAISVVCAILSLYIVAINDRVD
ncbi:lipopolysaccharide biosynthesis protein, partial [Bacteroidota bacterium]